MKIKRFSRHTLVPSPVFLGTAGFSLIELLVVVLVIGILAAVALPQYQRAVLKTRFSTLLPLMRSVDSAQRVYFMANNKYSASFDDLDVAMPSGAQVGNAGGLPLLTYEGFRCWLQGADNGRSIKCAFKNVGATLEKYFNSPHFICWAWTEQDRYLCSSLSGSGPAGKDGTGAVDRYDF